ncbi:MAG: ATP-dependent 6-phosphofructokinase [Bacteroidetes bacterium]|nr:ATP-dependent 6-phosphofructokinase [Bacteroidota bacterium]MCL2303210.1 ATP-dependent 6-phosphofructokinase [Lentimicrobiaceae bacterium]
MSKRILVVTGGGDCPGLNAVIRGIVKSAKLDGNWEIIGCVESYNGLLKDKIEVMPLTEKEVAGIHVKGGTIIKTTNKGGPFSFPVQLPDGSWVIEDRSQLLLQRLEEMGIEAIISIGGDGSQKISLELAKLGVNIIGVPKTIDNDLSCTDFTFGFQTAVEIATDAVDKLVTTAESHNRVFILEVMGRNAGWIALYTALGGGADVCIIPEIPYDPKIIAEKIATRYKGGEGFCNIVIAEGARDMTGQVTGTAPTAIGDEHIKLGGAGDKLKYELEQLGVQHDIRVTVLGHLQRGGIPIAYDRILATAYGVKAFELVKEKKYGNMVVYNHPEITYVPLKKVVEKPNFVNPKNDSFLCAAKKIGISFGD